MCQPLRGKSNLTAKMLQAINADLERRGLLMRAGTIVDATLIAAPSSTKNKSRQHDTEMHSTKKGQQQLLWHVNPHRCK